MALERLLNRLRGSARLAYPGDCGVLCRAPAPIAGVARGLGYGRDTPVPAGHPRSRLVADGCLRLSTDLARLQMGQRDGGDPAGLHP
jgi:hypothetical protein